MKCNFCENPESLIETDTCCTGCDKLKDEIFRYWVDDGLQIRTCRHCKISEFKSPVDGEWISYVTLERVEFCFECILNNEFDKLDCKFCNVN